MELMTKEILDRIPPLYSQDGKGEDAIAHVKLFNPCGPGTWYLSEYDPEERLAFGLCEIHEAELGYVSLTELEGIKLFAGLKIERDIHWTPRPIRECRRD